MTRRKSHPPDNAASAPREPPLRQDAPASAHRRREWPAVLLVVTLGFLLRTAAPDRMAVEHFDEGVYASNLYFDLDEPPAYYPDRHLYAPPLLPALLEWSMILSGDASFVMWPNVAAGALLVLLVWWTAREWFGPSSALAAALFAAASEFHIAFSRTALTDSLLTLWMLAGVYAGWRAVLSGRPLWIVAAGALAGLAWCTKYNGWLTLAVTGAGCAAWLLFSRPRRVSRIMVLVRWTATAAVAFGLFWWIAVRGLEDVGGYAAVSENHARYFEGLRGWWPNLLQQYAAHRVLDGWLTWSGLSAAILAVIAVGRDRFTWNGPGRWATPALLCTAVVAIAVFAGSTIVLALAAAAGLWRMHRAGKTGSRPGDPERKQQPADASASLPQRQLAAWMLAAWLIGLFVATPLYHPYPRLSLAWLVAAWIAAAYTLSSIFSRAGGETISSRFAAFSTGKRFAAGLAVILLLGLGLWRGSEENRLSAMVAWEDRTGLQQTALQVLRTVENTVDELPPSTAAGIDAVIYVYAEPALFFHLESAAETTTLKYVTQPAGNLDLLHPGETDSRVPTFLVIGPHARRAGIEDSLDADGVTIVNDFDYRPSTLVRLDENPQAVLDSPLPATDRVRLYLVHSADTPP